MESAGLPPGWKKEEVVCKSGISSGKTEIVYRSPEGFIVRSKAQVERFLGAKYDLSSFDFRSSRQHLHKSSQRKMRHDGTTSLPIRQTASIFKQPVTVVKTHKEIESKGDLKHGRQEKPRQLFWEKRLERLRACDKNQEPLDPLVLPRCIKVIGPYANDSEVASANALRSIAASLHMNVAPVRGQTAVAQITKNPSAAMDVRQPLIAQVVVSEEDLKQQELRVAEARRRLCQAITATS